MTVRPSRGTGVALMEAEVLEDVAPTISVDTRWRPLLRLGAGAAVFVVIMIPIQALVFILSPPPQTILEYFDLFHAGRPLGVGVEVGGDSEDLGGIGAYLDRLNRAFNHFFPPG